MHGHRRYDPPTQSAEAANVPELDSDIGKKWHCMQGGGPDASVKAEKHREKQEHLSALVVFALDDFVTGAESLG
jgi:hypothetical protein